MDSETASPEPEVVASPEATTFFPPSRYGFLTRQFLVLTHGIFGLGSFVLSVIEVAGVKLFRSRNVVWPQIRLQILLGGVKQTPMICFMAIGMGFIVSGQLLVLKELTGFESQSFAGGTIVTVVLRELGALMTALLILARVGAANVIELGAARSTGQVQALAAAGVDPIHYLVVPRVIGLGLSVFCLTFLFNLLTTVSAYLFLFVQDMDLPLVDYADQLMANLRILDFAVMLLKPMLFGFTIGFVSCYQGLTRVSRLEQIAAATTTAVVQGVVVCMLIDALFIVFYYLI
ncbi:MAG: ABC transporter permease [Verrucomicrobiia bacterium]